MAPIGSAHTAAVTGRSRFPSTRYQGSKRKLAEAIVAQVGSLDFESVLDAFGGTGSVAYAFKRAGCAVTYNDALAFNQQIGLALIENDSAQLPEGVIAGIGTRRADRSYGDLIERTFGGIYFTEEENRWLDVAVGNIRAIRSTFQRAIAWYALFQSAMAKRPYNLFHRRNLYMRTAEVHRGFGNKATWDRGFDDHFRACAVQANDAVFDSGGRCRAICRGALDVEPSFDLVYIDTPYINRSGVGVDYHHFYHLLEGMIRYDDWAEAIDYGSKHRRLRRRDDPWTDPRRVHEQFRRLFDHFRDSILVVSYRSDGIPSIEELRGMLLEVKRRVRVIDGPAYQYALSTDRRNREVLLVGAD
jgi:16S rRNA G966 N2-methylase RsmD